LVIAEGRGSPEGGVHRGTTRLEGNGGGGQRPVVGVGGVASKESVGGRRRLGGGRCLE
jgi:hypothetical protein